MPHELDTLRIKIEAFELARRMVGGDGTDQDVARFREIARSSPECVRELGEIRGVIERELAACRGPGGTVTAESVEAGTRAYEIELGYEDSKGLQRMLIDNVLTCWAVLRDVEYSCHCARLQMGNNVDVVMYWEGRLDGAQARFLKASDMLARARRMLGPMLRG